METGDFFSICIPYYRRPHYLKRLVDSIHEYADMPFEIIVHDDHGIDHSTDIVKDKVSTVIHNYGFNFGLSEASNRAIKLASSNNILFMNHDCIMTGPCLKAFKTILERPYVGMINGYGEPPEYPKRYLEHKNVRFFLKGGVGGCCIQIFRKDVWNYIGGFEPVDSGRADTCIPFKCYRHGYFRARLVGEFPFRNLSHEKNNIDTTLDGSRELHFPKLFHISGEDYFRACQERLETWQKYGRDEEFKPEGIANLKFWHGFTSRMIPDNDPLHIDWELAEGYGQVKWKKMIMKDVVEVG